MRPYRPFFEAEDYKGEHTAPDRESGSPLHDVTANGIYPEDFYGPNAVQYYGAGEPFDRETISTVHAYRNKPNTLVKIYRAVPDANHDIDRKVKDLSGIITYTNQFGFPPLKSEWSDTWMKVKFNKDTFIKKIDKEIDRLERSKVKDKLTINKGDWVSISRKYVVGHGRSALNGRYKILSKSVKARDIYTAGDSIHEWGYDPA